MATLRDSLLPVIDEIRRIPGPDGVGVRTSRVYRVVRTWSGGSVRLGTSTDSTTEIVPRPKVREEMSGNELTVGPITAAHVGGGYAQSDLVPTLTAAQEVFWQVVGENGTRTLELVDIDTSKPFRFTLRLRTLERVRPY